MNQRVSDNNPRMGNCHVNVQSLPSSAMSASYIYSLGILPFIWQFLAIIFSL